MLSTTISQRIKVDLSISGAKELCTRIVSDFGWEIIEESDAILKMKEGELSGESFVWPAEVEIKVSTDNDGITCILLKGKSFGHGAKQKGHIEGHLWNIRNRIEGIAEVI